MAKFIIGIDEAGRGPLAGPVAVGAVCLKPAARLNLAGLKDSKQLAASQREKWFAKILAWQKEGVLDFRVALVGAKLIDEAGIVPAIKLGIARCLKRLQIMPAECQVLLDGGLKAPAIYLVQKTIIKGDESESAIALASIAAKVRRDRHLTRLAKLYPAYGFEVHKGYGTKAHYQALAKHGPSKIHRQTFL